jgi:hypothetical protein
VARKDCSERQACRFFAMHRATCRYRPKLPCLRQQQIEQAVVDLSLKNPELGADKIAAMVRRGGVRPTNGSGRSGLTNV